MRGEGPPFCTRRSVAARDLLFMLWEGRMDDNTRWPKWLGWITAVALSSMLWFVCYMIWKTVQKL